jgi:glycosyltransferase involved in cell wall biosynthesis
MKLSIVIPTYNSANKLEELIDRLKKIKIPGITNEIIVVDDCSKDTTLKVAKKIKGITLIHHVKNTGKGGAVKTGLAKATGDILFIQDDDLEYDPAEIPKLIRPIIQKKVSVVFGSRRLNKKNTYSSPKYYFGGVLIDSIISLVLMTRLTDAITGSKAFTREVYNKIKPITSKGFEIEAEIAVKVVRAGYKPHEIPITYSPRSEKEGKNIRWHHALPILKTLFYYAIFYQRNKR